MTNSSVGRLRGRVAGLLIAALGLFGVSTAGAQELGNTTSFFLPSGTLIMPFDNTTNHASFQVVTRVGPGLGSGGPIATHWSYWSANCRHLVDVFVCLTPGDTKVMDPAQVRGEIQSPSPPSNNAIGAITDLTGERGLVTVTAFEADTGLSGLECNVVDPGAFLTSEIFGGWVIANTSSNAAFGADAIGLAPDALPEPTLIVRSGLMVQSFNPQSLGDSEVITLGVEVPAGSGAFLDSEPGPIQRDRPDGHHVCCNVTFTDNLEITTSLPDLCFECVDFRPISFLQAEGGEASLIPPNTSVDSPGFLTLRNCTTGTTDGRIDELGAEFEQFIFAVHGQAIGQFGFAVHGRYTCGNGFASGQAIGPSGGAVRGGSTCADLS